MPAIQRSNIQSRLALCAGLISSCTIGAFGQQAPVEDPARASPPKEAEQQVGPLNFTLGAAETYTFESDVDDSTASVSHARTDLSIGVGWNVSEALQFNLLVDGELSFYDWNDASGILPGMSEPLDDLFSTGVLLRGTWVFDNPWYTTGGVAVRTGWESGADASDGFTIAGYGALGYNFSKELTVAVGMGVTSRLDDNLTPFPFIAFRWQINDKLVLTSRALGLSLTYAVNDSFDVTLGGGFDRREYRLSDDRLVLADGVSRVDRVPIGVEFSWKAAEGLTLALTGGVHVYQHFEFLNENGNEVLEIETNPAAFVGVRLEYSF